VSTPSADDNQQANERLNTPGDPTPNPQVIPGNSEFGNRYPRAFKIKILNEADACNQPGQIGKLLKSAGITHATLTTFRRQRAAGTLDAPETKTRKQAPATLTPQNTERVLQLERENRKLKRRLEQAEAIIEIQKKVSRLLEISLEPSEEGNK